MGITAYNASEIDAPRILDMLQACGAFSSEEVEVAFGMYREAIAGEYLLGAAALDGRLAGYVVAGRTPLTQSTWHMYWICVHPDCQASGVGTFLQHWLEAEVRRQGGARIVVETSGRSDYVRTRRFYENAGYFQYGRIPDYYKPQDDCILYAKML